VDGSLELFGESVVVGSERDGAEGLQPGVCCEASGQQRKRCEGATNGSPAHNCSACDSMDLESSPYGCTLVPGLNLGGGA
jgi:hypothetical protein